MALINKQQIIKAKVQLRKLGLDSEEMALTYSDGRTTHISGLYGGEAAELIQYLSASLNEPETPKERMKRKILSMAHELGWKFRGKVDLRRVNGWCEKYGYLGKPLKAYTESELPALVTQFEKMYAKELKSI